MGATIGADLPGARRGNMTMDDSITVPSSNVLPFAPEDRKRAAPDIYDHGPSPEESLRIMPLASRVWQPPHF